MPRAPLKIRIDFDIDDDEEVTFHCVAMRGKRVLARGTSCESSPRAIKLAIASVVDTTSPDVVTAREALCGLLELVGASDDDEAN